MAYRKYRNIPKNGYHSGMEADRATELELLLKAGKISDLRKQVIYNLIPKQEGEIKVYYRADFVYVQDGQTIVEDVKGYRTADYIIKRKLMLYVHGIRILETGSTKKKRSKNAKKPANPATKRK